MHDNDREYPCNYSFFFFLSVNLAVAMKQEYPNKEIGLLDADIFGPSLPLLMNLHEQPLTDSSKLKFM